MDVLCALHNCWKLKNLKSYFTILGTIADAMSIFADDVDSTAGLATIRSANAEFIAKLKVISTFRLFYHIFY